MKQLKRLLREPLFLGTALGESARNQERQVEAWFDPAQAGALRLVQRGFVEIAGDRCGYLLRVKVSVPWQFGVSQSPLARSPSFGNFP